MLLAECAPMQHIVQNAIKHGFTIQLIILVQPYAPHICPIAPTVQAQANAHNAMADII